MATISTHNGSTLSQGHNRRDRKITDKEEHIDPKRIHEDWLDKDIKEAYADIFGGAVSEYNEKQTRKDRQIEDYYQKIENDQKKHVAYEMIVGVYGKDSTPQQKKEILWDFASTWQKRNPNLIMIGCYYHYDEIDPVTKRITEQHLHIDYVPIAQCDRGMKLQNSLDRGLMQQGIECGTSIHETRQINWEKRENAYLEELCRQRGIVVQHEDFSRPHLHTSAYKRRMIAKENRELQEQNKALQEETKKQQEINEKNQRALQNQVTAYRQREAEMEQMAKKLSYAEAKLEELKDDYVTESFGNMRQFATPEAIEAKRKELDF